jgi:acyl carrier protein
LFRASGEAIGLVRSRKSLAASDPFPPWLLDACMQVIAAAVDPLALQILNAGAVVPIAVERFAVHGPAEPEMWSHVRLRASADPARRIPQTDIRVLNAAGRLIAELIGIQLEAAPSRAVQRPKSSLAKLNKSSASRKQTPAATMQAAAVQTDPVQADPAQADATRLTRESLLAIDPGRRAAHLSDYLHDRLVLALGMGPVQLDRNESLLNLGLDSLTVIKLNTQLERALRVEIPMHLLLSGPSIVQVTAALLEQGKEA